jgi:hypothetical protein
MIHVIGGGTFSHVRNHLALAAPAFGGTARYLERVIINTMVEAAREGRAISNTYATVLEEQAEREVTLHLTKMADHTSSLVTNQDVSDLVDGLIADPETRVIIMNAALCDYDGVVMKTAQPPSTYLWDRTNSGSHEERLKTSEGSRWMALDPADKLISRIRKERKDIFLVAFKTTTGATPDEQYAAGLHLLKANSANLVLANDTVTRLNMVVTPEESRHFQTHDRNECLDGLVEMLLSRSTNTFTRSTVVDGPPVAWGDPRVPENLREVVNHCIVRGAYKPFRGATVGHFAAKIDDGSILTSRRKRDFNKLPEEGLILVEYGDEKVIAHGGKPSVGGQSQRVIFREHPEAECIVHFHCPPRDGASEVLSHVDQRPNECGSHQCGQATSRGLQKVAPGIKAVMLDEHGPNIVFSRSTPALEVIAFIETHFDLSAKTGGLVA